MNNRTFIEDKNGNRYFFDVNTDTNKNSSSDVADSPIDARGGATLQDKRVVNMKTVGISGKFSSRCANNSSFNVGDNRLGIIINYFENALEKQEIYTVCKKGKMYYNMMLEKLNLRFGEYISTVEIVLGFREVNIIGTDAPNTYKIMLESAYYDKAEELSLVYGKNNDSSFYFKSYSPRLSGAYMASLKRVIIGVTNPNNKDFDMRAVVNLRYTKNGGKICKSWTLHLKGGTSGSIIQDIGEVDSAVVSAYFKPFKATIGNREETIRQSDTMSLDLVKDDSEDSSST